MATQAQIIAQAAAHYGVPANVIWGIFGTESSFGQNPSTSSAGAQGPFQFIPSTARQYGVNVNSLQSSAFGAAHYLSDLLHQHGGNMNAALNAYNGNGNGAGGSSYTNSVFGNARSWRGPNVASSASGGGQMVNGQFVPGTPGSIPNPGTGQLADLIQAMQQQSPPHPPMLGYPQTPAFSAQASLAMPTGYQQVPSASPSYMKFMTQPSVSTDQIMQMIQGLDTSGTADPGSPATMTFGGGGPGGRGVGGIISRKNLGRTDQGVDFTGSGIVPAIASGRVSRVVPRGGNSGWPGGGFIDVTMDQPVNVNGRQTRDYYLAENINPSVRVGQRVSRGQPLAQALGAYPYIEYGWAANPSGQTLAQATSGYREGQATPAGQSFLRYLNALGL